MLNFEFIAPTNAEICRGSQNSPEWSADLPVTPFWPKFSFFMIGHLAIILHAKFRISSLNRCPDMEGVRKFTKMVTWLPGEPFSPKFSFSTIGHLAIILHAKFRISSFNRCRDMYGVSKFPKMVRWPRGDPFLPKFSFSKIAHLRVILHAKCRISSLSPVSYTHLTLPTIYSV